MRWQDARVRACDIGSHPAACEVERNRRPGEDTRAPMGATPVPLPDDAPMKHSTLAAGVLVAVCALLNACTGKPETAQVADADVANAANEAGPVTLPATDSASAAPQQDAHGATEAVSAEPVIEDAWIRIPPAGAPVAGGYMVLHNPGSQDDRLLAVRSPMAERVEIHEMRMDGEVMQMRELPNGLQLAAGHTVTLGPGSTHLMFMQPRAGLAVGNEVEAVLVFERAGERTVRFQVRDERGNAVPRDAADGHDIAEHAGH